MSEQKDIWDMKPLRFSTAGVEGQGSYHAGNMDAWLEKLKAAGEEIAGKLEDLKALWVFLEPQKPTKYLPTGHEYYYAKGIDTAKQRLKEIVEG